MKCRTDLVTNSSSSLFTIYKKDLNRAQISFIKMLSTGEIKYDKYKEDNEYSCDEWSIFDNDDEFEFSTSMDNFNMEEYLVKKLDINLDILHYGSY